MGELCEVSMPLRPDRVVELAPKSTEEVEMADSVYRVTEVIGVSPDSWEAAARNAVETAGSTIRDLRVAEVLRQDLSIENGKVTAYRVRLGISFKYETDD
jgi:flavin-binding protein dodecin